MQSTAIDFLIPNLPSTEELLPWLKRIDASKQYSNFGPLAVEYESVLSDFLSSKSEAKVYCTSCSSGTQALELSLRALSLPEKSKVLVPAYTFIATGLAILNAGLTPVMADVDSETWLFTPETAKAHLIDKDIAAIVPVTAFGAPQPVDAWDEFDIPVIIDAAGALSDQHMDTSSHYCFSLHATKLLGIGEGGFIASHDKEFIETVRSYSQFGLKDGVVVYAGGNSKLSEYHAAVGLAQMARCDQVCDLAQTIQAAYRSQLNAITSVTLQKNPTSFSSSVLPIQCPSLEFKAELKSRLSENAIGFKEYYSPSLDQHPIFQRFDRAPLNNTKKLSEHGICLPFHAFLSNEDIERVVKQLQILQG